MTTPPIETPERPSLAIDRQEQSRWRSIIRVFAIIGAIMGLALIGNEILENITCEGQAYCGKIHLSTFFVGLSMFGLCLLILQKGDVSLSFQQAAATGTIVRSWFTRAGRATDAPNTVVTTVVEKPVTPLEG